MTRGTTAAVRTPAPPIVLTVGGAKPTRVSNEISQLRVLAIVPSATPPAGVAAVVAASESLDGEFLFAARTFDMLRAIGSAPNVESARHTALEHAVGADVVVVVQNDELTRLSESSVERGVEALADIGLPVLMLTSFGDERPEDYGFASSWLRRHVRGVISCDATQTEIAAAIRAVRAGLIVVEPRVSEALQQAALRKRPPARTSESAIARSSDNAPPLSAREREVLALLAEGLATKNIAHQLGISAHTVKAHVESIFAKFGATTRAEAVAIGVRRGQVLL